MIAHEEGRKAVHIGQQQEGDASGSNLWKQAGRTRTLGGRW